MTISEQIKAQDSMQAEASGLEKIVDSYVKEIGEIILRENARGLKSIEGWLTSVPYSYSEFGKSFATKYASEDENEVAAILDMIAKGLQSQGITVLKAKYKKGSYCPVTKTISQRSIFGKVTTKEVEVGAYYYGFYFSLKW